MLVENLWMLNQSGLIIRLKLWLKQNIKVCQNLKIRKLFANFVNSAKNGSDQYLQMKLKSAIFSGSVERTGFLLRNGAYIDTLQRQDWPVSRNVFKIKKFGFRSKMLNLLLEFGMDPDLCRNKFDESLISQFFRYYYEADDVDAVEICEILIESGVSANEPDDRGWTPLRYSIESNNFQLFTYLVKQGKADVNESSLPLHLVIRNNMIDFVDFLLISSADVNIKDEDDWTPLHWACYFNNKTVISLLLRKGADVNVYTDINQTPYSMLDTNKEHYDECIRIMMKEMARLQINKLKISSKDVNLIKKNAASREFFKKCTKELCTMKNTTFYNSFSYYCVLKMSNNIRKLAKYTKNSDFVEKYVTGLCFPTYNCDLQRIINEAIHVKNELLLIENRLKNIFGDIFPYLVIIELAEYLKLENLPLE